MDESLVNEFIRTTSNLVSIFEDSAQYALSTTSTKLKEICHRNRLYSCGVVRATRSRSLCSECVRSCGQDTKTAAVASSCCLRLWAMPN